MRYTLIPTSAEVVAVLHARHAKELTVFGSFSDPTGTAHGGSGETGKMMTQWGFVGADYALFQVTSTRKPPESDNVEQQYHLCVAHQEES